MIAHSTDTIILNYFQQVFIEHPTWVFINRQNVLLSYLMNIEQTASTLSMGLQICILQIKIDTIDPLVQLWAK